MSQSPCTRRQRLADGDTSTLEERKIYEGDINDLPTARTAGRRPARYLQVGGCLSSLEVKDASGEKFIHGKYAGERKHVRASQEATTRRQGHGPGRARGARADGDAVSSSGAQLRLQPLVSEMLVPNTAISATSAFTVRDDRDLTQIYQSDPAAPDPVSRCDLYDSFPAI